MGGGGQILKGVWSISIFYLILHTFLHEVEIILSQKGSSSKPFEPNPHKSATSSYSVKYKTYSGIDVCQTSRLIENGMLYAWNDLVMQSK